MPTPCPRGRKTGTDFKQKQETVDSKVHQQRAPTLLTEQQLVTAGFGDYTKIEDGPVVYKCANCSTTWTTSCAGRCHA